MSNIPRVPKVDLSGPMQEMLDNLRILRKFVDEKKEEIQEAKVEIKETERLLVQLNARTSVPVNVPPRTSGKVGGQTKTRTRRVNVLWQWNESKGMYMCMVKGCRVGRQSSPGMTSHFKRDHPKQYAKNSL